MEMIQIKVHINFFSLEQKMYNPVGSLTGTRNVGIEANDPMVKKRKGKKQGKNLPKKEE